MDKLDILVPGHIGQAATFKVKNRAISGSRKVWQKANQIRAFYGLESVHTAFVAKALHNLPETLVTKCAVAAKELGGSPSAYFVRCIKNELAGRGL